MRAMFALGLLALVPVGMPTAQAATFWIEAESVREKTDAITAPMSIKDSDPASGGSYVEVAAGNNSQASMPVAEGVLTYAIDVETDATFRIWARVIAATDGDDSFWVKMDDGSPIKWNGIPLGSSWHWTQVKAEGAASPAAFALGVGQHILKVAYREDGARLDALVVTDDPTFNPTAPLVGPPDTPVLTYSEWATLKGVSLTWQAVPGAQSYTVQDDNGNVLASGITGHRYRRPSPAEMSVCTSVYAVAATGSSLAASDCSGTWGTQRRIYPSDLNVTAPMQRTDNGIEAAPGTPEALSAPAAKGRAALDFATASSTKMEVWFSGSAPNPDTDSFWIRLDGGAWLKWNNIPSSFSCNPVTNSDGTRVVFNFTAGTHRFEIANRETGTSFWKMFFTEDLGSGANCHD